MSFRAFLVLAAAVAIVVLAIFVLAHNPTHNEDLTAWALIAAGVAFVLDVVVVDAP